MNTNLLETYKYHDVMRLFPQFSPLERYADEGWTEYCMFYSKDSHMCVCIPDVKSDDLHVFFEDFGENGDLEYFKKPEDLRKYMRDNVWLKKRQ